jgi:hypothetical protein
MPQHVIESKAMLREHVTIYFLKCIPNGYHSHVTPL